MSQGDVRVKARHALARGNGRGVVVYNDEDREHLKKEVSKVMLSIQSASPQWWATLCLILPPLGASAAVYSIWRNWRLQKAWNEIMKQEKAKL